MRGETAIFVYEPVPRLYAHSAQAMRALAHLAGLAGMAPVAVCPAEDGKLPPGLPDGILVFDETGTTDPEPPMNRFVSRLPGGRYAYRGPLATAAMRQASMDTQWSRIEGILHDVMGMLAPWGMGPAPGEAVPMVDALTYGRERGECLDLLARSAMRLERERTLSHEGLELYCAEGEPAVGSGPGGLSRRLADVEEIWYSQISPESPTFDYPRIDYADGIRAVGEELGIMPIIDAYYEGVPLADIMA